MPERVYLDWNATAPLRPEAREAMLAAMDAVGNPSSVHAEGRTARAIVERARAQVAGLVGCDPAFVVFTGGATEACRMALTHPRWTFVGATALEHEAVTGAVTSLPHGRMVSRAGRSGQIDTFGGSSNGIPGETGIFNDGGPPFWHGQDERSAFGGLMREAEAAEAPLIVFPSANGETGIVQTAYPPIDAGVAVFRDITQALGKLEQRATALATGGIGQDGILAFSAHKMGGPKGVGGLVIGGNIDLTETARGGGQELGRRSGTENVIGIAGFGAAAEAAARDIANGEWERVAALRDLLEAALDSDTDTTIFVGNGVARLPNTSCILTPGWKGETQVMAMDLAGYAISAGSACSSGKVKTSRVLKAMGYTDEEAGSAIRVSLGPATTEQDVLGFAEAWTRQYRRWKTRAA